MPRTLLAPAIALLLGVAAGCASTGDEPPPGAPAAEILEAGKAQLALDHPNRAGDLFERVVDEWAETPEAEEAAWLAAETWFSQERWRKSRTGYEAYHEANPLGRLGELENRVYEIGVKLYEDGQSGLFGLGIFPSVGESPETFEWLLANLPTGARADDALMFMARGYLEDERWADALLHLDRILADYPQSEWTLSARFLKAGAHRSLARGAHYDGKALLDARKSYETYVKLVEKDPARQVEYAEKLAEANAAIDDIDEVLTEKDLLIGQWYLSQERYGAARIYLAEAAAGRPGAKSASEAQELLDEMKGAGQ